VFQVGDPLAFVSDSEIKRPVQIEWHDILFCDFGNGNVFVSDYRTGKYFEEPRPREKGEWRYSAKVPMKEASCYVRSTIKAEMKWSENKTQTIEGPSFVIKN
jgi:hypothetical protein